VALPPVLVPPTVDVPAAPGIPPVIRSATAAVDTIGLLVADAVTIVRLFEGPQWGIFSSTGAPALIGDSVIAVDYRKEYAIPDYPIEEGAFASYNKVQRPFDVRVSFANTGKLSILGSLLSGGAIGSLITGVDPNTAGRRRFLQQVDAAIASLDMFTVVTPEASYANVNLIHADYRREAAGGGATMIRIDVWCQEVRFGSRATSTGTESTDPAAADPNSAQPSTTNVGANTAQPDGASPQSSGTVQTQPANSTATSPNLTAPPGAGGAATTGPGAGSQPLESVYDADGNWSGYQTPGFGPTGTPGNGPLAQPPT
jgi:hypothetical protein